MAIKLTFKEFEPVLKAFLKLTITKIFPTNHMSDGNVDCNCCLLTIPRSYLYLDMSHLDVEGCKSLCLSCLGDALKDIDTMV